MAQIWRNCCWALFEAMLWKSEKQKKIWSGYCRLLDDPFFSDLRSDHDPLVKNGSAIRSDPFTLLRKGSKIRSNPILFDPFPILFPILIIHAYGHFTTQKLLEVDPSKKFWTQTGPEEKIFDPRHGPRQKKGPETRPAPKKGPRPSSSWYIFRKKDLEQKSDPFRSDPWFFGSAIRSRSSGKKGSAIRSSNTLQITYLVIFYLYI